MKKPSKLTLCVIAAAVFSVAGCTSPSPSPSNSLSLKESELPPIRSRAVKDGKGLPNGRSDSEEPYVRTRLKVSTDPSYGYSKDKAIPVPIRAHPLYLNSLRGPLGQPIEYERRGSCCHFENATVPLRPLGGGLLDIYRIKADGDSSEVFLFLNGYEQGVPAVPMGFEQRK